MTTQPEIFGKIVRYLATIMRPLSGTPSLVGLSLALALGPSFAAERRVADLSDLSLEQLANIEVTSVSRRAESLAGAPASIYVITHEDIRRSGVKVPHKIFHRSALFPGE